MNVNWSALAVLAAVVLTWAGIFWLRKREVNFSLIALAALVVGVPIGLVAGENVEMIQPIGRIYISVLLATVAPLVFIAIVASITSLGNLAKLRSIGLRSMFWLLLSNALGVTLALGLGLAVAPGVGVNNALGAVPTDTIQGQVQSFGEVVVGFFPSNIIANFSTNAIIPIILVALTLSVAYLALAEEGAAKARPFRDGAEALKLVIFKAVGFVIRLTPYAIVALTAQIVGSNSNLGANFQSLVGLLLLVWAACFIHAFVVNGVLINVFARVPVVPFFRKILPAQLTAFTTQSSVGTLPVTTARLTREVGVHPEVAHFTAPLGTTIGMPGCAGIWPILIAVWGINAYNLPYTAVDYLVLAVLAVFVSVGTAGVPGAATVAAATVLSAAGLPLEFVAVTIPISIIADMARTMNNVTAAAVSATVVARQTGMLDDDIFAGRTTFVDEVEPTRDLIDPGPQLAPAPTPTPVPAPAAPRVEVPAAAPVWTGAPAAAGGYYPTGDPQPFPGVPAGAAAGHTTTAQFAPDPVAVGVALTAAGAAPPTSPERSPGALPVPASTPPGPGRRNSALAVASFGGALFGSVAGRRFGRRSNG